jgi:putative transposase
VKYAWVKQQTEFRVQPMCRALQVSRSGYYEYSHRLPSVHSIEHDRLRSQIKAAFEKGRKNYGTRRIKEALEKTKKHCQSPPYRPADGGRKSSSSNQTKV